MPSVYWFIDGTEPATYAEASAEGRIYVLPVNHSPLFIHPSLRAVEAMAIGALAWLAT